MNGVELIFPTIKSDIRFIVEQMQLSYDCCYVTKTLRTIHQFIRSLCSQIVDDPEPVRIPVVPDPTAKADECFLNVEANILRDGGGIKYG